MQITREDIGKRVKFRSLTRWNSRTVIRKIRDVRKDGAVIVYFGGYHDFAVYPHEVKEVLNEE